MKTIVLIFYSAVQLLTYSEALICWTCETQPSNNACQRTGRLTSCQENQGQCQNEVRRFINRIEVSKRCKQRQACDNNELQNKLVGVGAPSISQCTALQLDSTCRCCCGTNMCNNRLGLECFNVPPPPPASCRVPIVPRFGIRTCVPAKEINGRQANVGVSCSFRCTAGYTLIGSQRIECVKQGTTGTFNRRPPSCSRRICRPPRTPPKNGQVRCTNGNIARSTCTYSCNRGFSVRRGSRLTTYCTLRNRWTYSGVPTCEPIICVPTYRSGRRRSVECTKSNNLDSVCRFTCRQGYLLDGLSEITCNDDGNGDRFGRWSGRAPRCKQIQCLPLQTAPTRGSVSCSNGNNEGSVCSFTCDSGNFLDGSSSTTCEDDGDRDDEGIWSAAPPRCIRITCLPPRINPANGGVSCSNRNFFDSTCSYSCNNGFFLDGFNSTVCQDEDKNDARGSWSNPPPSCSRITCVPPQVNPDNGDVTCSNSNNLNSVCRFACQEGFATIGRSVIRCIDDMDGDDEGVWNRPTPTCGQIVCNPSHIAPENGLLSCTNANNYASECSFSCAAGFSLVGSSSSVCQSGSRGSTEGEWSHPAPVCISIVCNPAHVDPDGGEVVCSNGNFLGSNCQFTCDGGYFLSGSSTSTCTDDGDGDRIGVWNSVAPKCIRITCNPPFENLRNGEIDCSNDNFEGSVCRFSCNENLFLNGFSSSTCEDDDGLDENGAWSNVLPTCVRVRCLPPRLAPDNGDISCTRRNVAGSVCSYSCDSGYVINNPDLTTTLCRDDENGDAVGVWTQPAPTCVQITCSPPYVDPSNGKVVCSNQNYFASECDFTCNFGFFLNGSLKSTCEDDGDGNAAGVWSDTAPVCQRITCEPPHENPENGVVTCTSGNNFASSCLYTCNDGYFLDGADQSICQIDVDNGNEGVWSALPPKCVRIICSPPHTDPRNGVVACTNNNFLNSECTFTCNDGFFLGGESISTCVDDGDNDAIGSWNNPAPSCVRIVCNPPRQAPVNGSVSCSDGNSEDSVCIYICDDGFFLDGSSSTTCVDDNDGDRLGLWSNPPPVCVRITCSPSYVDQVSGGVSCSDDNNQGSVCSFTCDNGYFLDGSSTITCVDDDDNDAQGIWNGPPPTCVQITCSPPHTSPGNGSVDCSNDNIYQSVCSFTCNSAFFLDGETTSTCRDDENGDAIGSWSSPSPVCVAITCNPARTNPVNGQVSCSNGNSLNSECNYQCDQGYFLDGQDTTTCQDDNDNDADGVWSSGPPTCVRITCVPPHVSPRNGAVSCSDDNNYASTCSFTCNDGFFLGGESISTCVDDGDNDAIGSWNNPAPSCVRIVCNPPRQAPVNGSVLCSNGNSEDSVCRYTCDDGFFLDGSSSTTCVDDNDGDRLGLWSNPPPVCVRITCSPSYVDQVSGGVSCSDENNQGSVCSFTCDNGYFLDGSSTITCVDDEDNNAQGVWNRPPPTCVQITCSPPHTSPGNGSVDCSNDNIYQSVCSFTCNPAFFLDGETTSTCQDDDNGDAIGSWSSSSPVCVAITCNPARTNPVNGQVSCSNGNSLNSECNYQCDEGYFLDGQDTTTCQDDNDNDADGVWSSEPPTCVRITCVPPHVSPRNGVVSCSDDNNYASTCSFTCNDGFFLGGESISTCIDDGDNDAIGSWNNPAPSCVRIVCNPPRQAPVNGSVSCNDGNSEDSVCIYTCDDGFFLDGSSSTTCVDDNDGDRLGLWSNPPPVCVRITCSPSYVDQVNGGVSCSDDNNQGSVCSFICDNGYFLDGSSSITCVDDDDNDAQGIWNGPPPTCVQITCLPPHTSPGNGSVDCSNDNIYQSVCSFTCNPAFFLDGETTSTCQDNENDDAVGSWSSSSPVCVAITCNPARTNPVNGQVSCSNGNSLNSECNYQCDAGYFLDGQDTTTCQDDNDNDADGVWSSGPPTCVRITCVPPHVSPRNGAVSCSDNNNYDSTCSFTCNDGFFLGGEAISTCIDDGNNDAIGSWNNPAPSCVRIVCNPPRQAPVNGSVLCSDGNSEDSVCTYTCDNGFFLDGSSSTTCVDDNDGDHFGLWNNLPPVCVRITCSPSYVDQVSGGVSCSDDNYQGSVCSFTCNEGYFLDGSSTITCVDDDDNDAQGIWNGPPPTCVQITCSPPHTSPGNGSVDCSNDNLYGSVCSFTCNPAFFLDGETTSTCEDDDNGDAIGSWSSRSPVCVAITCNPARTDPVNGQVSCSNGNFLNSQCTYQCNVLDGYYLEGQATTTCQDDNDNDADGVWNSQPPICIKIRCEPPRVNPANGNVSCSDGNNYDSVCSFTCNDGYFLDGNAASTCLDDDVFDENGVWDFEAPTCVRIVCNPPRQSPVNGSVTCSNENNEDSVCTYTCDDGFFLDGSSSTTCVDDNDGDNLGLWNNPPPVCVRITCLPSYVDQVNGGVSCSDDNNQGSVCSFTCDNGYFLDGLSTITCVDDDDNDAQGVWNGPPPTCVQITCSPPHTSPGNGSVDCSNDNLYGSVCSFSCNSAFFLDGLASSACIDDGDDDAMGIWNNSAPVCVIITCNPIRTNPDNGGVRCTSGNLLNSQCTYQCDAGYFLDGQDTTTCQDDNDNDADGVWSSDPPTCVRITCAPPHLRPINGGIFCTDENNFNSTCSFTCNDGYFLNGNVASTCLDDDVFDPNGVWDFEAPTCVRIVCDPPRQNPVNGSVSCSNGNNEDSVCNYTCDGGFFLDGSSTTTCVDDDDGDRLGLWSNPPPVCIRITCLPSYADQVNGGVSCSDDNNQGSVCSFTCDNGYFLDGSSSITCVDDDDNDAQGVWNGPPPTCVQITCSPPHTSPGNGSVDCSNDNLYGSVCSFICNSAFFLDGLASSTCIDDGDNDAMGIWNNSAPVCVIITCNPTRTSPDNGGVSCTNGNFLSSQCSYQCDAGYFLDGQDTTTCQDDNDNDADGVWSSGPPTCVRITCQPPHVNPENGAVFCFDGNNFDSTCSFTCNDGFFLDGSVNSVCIDEDQNDAIGSWSNPAPSCVRIVCNPPRQAPVNGSVLCSDGNSEDSVCTYTCDDGFFLDGSSSTTCVDDNDGNRLGLWSNPPPVCIRITCSPSYVDQLNGGVSCSDDNNQGSVCSFTCNEGYFLDGSLTITCVDDDDNDAQGIWNGPPPTCVQITCSPPHTSPGNGSVDCSNENLYGSVCEFSCRGGFFLDGLASSTCIDDGDNDAMGIWNNPAPVCVIITCNPTRTSPDNGGVSCTNGNFLNSQCSYQCDAEYFLDGQDTTTCQDDNDNDADGVWSSEPPTCVRITCQPPFDSLENGATFCSNSNFNNSMCFSTCNDGYFLEGQIQSVCVDDNDNDAFGEWTNPAPTCFRIVCIPPRMSPENGTVECSDGNNLESLCTFTCDEDFALIGQSQTTCVDIDQNDRLGSWNAPSPICRHIECLPIQTDPENGAVECSNGNFAKSSCEFSCNENYYLSGSVELECIADQSAGTGSWSHATPTCEKITCVPSLEEFGNGTASCSDENFIDSTCSFTCDEEYRLSGAATITCHNDGDGNAFGEWSEPPPVCERESCTSFTSIEGGVVMCFGGNFVNAECEITCDDDRDLIGTDFIACVTDETDPNAPPFWTDPFPECRLRLCEPAPEAPENGFRVCTNGNLVGSQCTYGCNDFYKTVGPEVSTCIQVVEGTYNWNIPPPGCEAITCPAQTLKNGEVDCDDPSLIESTECTFSCNARYSLFPPTIANNTCLADESWSVGAPCCARICPPNANMDLAIVLDSSTSIKVSNWMRMQMFVKTLIQIFDVGPDASRFALTRFGREVDVDNTILFEQFRDDKATLIEAVDAMVYNGSEKNNGTLTGNALRYVRDTIFSPSNGNRPGSQDVILLITDGRAQDDVVTIAQELRSEGVLIYVIGVYPPLQRIGFRELIQIAGDRSNVILPLRGFDDLDEKLAFEISKDFCPLPCTD